MCTISLGYTYVTKVLSTYISILVQWFVCVLWLVFGLCFPMLHVAGRHGGFMVGWTRVGSPCCSVQGSSSSSGAMMQLWVVLHGRGIEDNGRLINRRGEGGGRKRRGNHPSTWFVQEITFTCIAHTISYHISLYSLLHNLNLSHTHILHTPQTAISVGEQGH